MWIGNWRWTHPKKKFGGGSELLRVYPYTLNCTIFLVIKAQNLPLIFCENFQNFFYYILDSHSLILLDFWSIQFFELDIFSIMEMTKTFYHNLTVSQPSPAGCGLPMVLSRNAGCHVISTVKKLQSLKINK